MIYLDFVSTTPLNPEVKAGYEKLLKEHFANSDSLYGLGMKVNILLEKSRSLIAKLLNVKNDEIIFTSGASEANTFAIKGTVFSYQNRGKHIITTCFEHSSVAHCFEQLEKVFGFEVDYIHLNEEGKLDLEELKSLIREDTILVSTMFVNNEVGIVNDIKTISKIIRDANPKTKYHVDCVQALGKYPIDLSLCDLASFSAHKINGLKGSGVLYKSKSTHLEPLINGGQQEFGIRGGTENAPTHIMFAKTLRIALENQLTHFQYVSKLNEYLRSKLENEEIHINSDENCSPYILNISLPNYKPEVILHALEAKEIYISTKSTCSSHSSDAVTTLVEMHLEEKYTISAIRISLSYMTTKEEIDTFVKTLYACLKEVRKRG